MTTRFRSNHPISIGDTPIGAGCPTYVIAEAGVNHDGSVDKARSLIDAAAEAGANAVKFQAFHATDLTTSDAPAAAYQTTANGSQRALLEALELTAADFDTLAAHCRARCIEFLATPFGLAELKLLLNLGVNAIKLASTDLNNVPLVQAAAEAGKTLIVSTGAATADEIHAACTRLRAWGAYDRLVLLHCVSCYPTPMDQANLRAIRALHDTYRVPVGFSDHVQSTQTGALAVAAGAMVLEKHLTLERTAAGPDHALSLEPAQMCEYIRLVREAEAALGTGTLGMSAIEADVRRVARKSIVAACNLPAGTVLTPELLCVKRPAGGIEPDQIESLAGRRLTVAVTADTRIQWDMVQ